MWGVPAFFYDLFFGGCNGLYTNWVLNADSGRDRFILTH